MSTRTSTATGTAIRLRLARVAFTGKLASMTRLEAEQIVRQSGGRVVRHVSQRTSLLVVGMAGWPLLPDGTVSAKLRRAEELNGRGARIRIVSEQVFLEAAGLREQRRQVGKSYSAEEIRGLLGVTPAALRRWEQLSLVRSQDGKYDFQDLVSLRVIADLVGRGVRPDVIARSLHGLASVLPGTDRPLAQLKIVQSGSKALVAELGEALVGPDGQLLLNFDTPPAGERDAAILSRSEAAAGAGSADAWFEQGEALEEQERFEEAIEAYRSALRRRPDWAEAHFNLGNALRVLGRADEALAAFQAAVECDRAMASAWYNLADLEEECGNLGQAVEALRSALVISPAYADAHFNLAHCLERLGRGREAARHWARYLDFDPDSEWAHVARARREALSASDEP